MSEAVLVAVVAAIGNLLQGWDNATIAGSVFYIKREFNLESEPIIEGLIVVMSLIGGTLITTCSGALADWLGRRPLMIISFVLYFISGLVMLWPPNVYVLLFARLLDGFGVGLAVTLVPIYISETASPQNKRITEFPPPVHWFWGYVYVVLHGVWDVVDENTELEVDAGDSFCSFSCLLCIGNIIHGCTTSCGYWAKTTTATGFSGYLIFSNRNR